MRAVLRRWWWLPPLTLLWILAWGPALVGPFQFDDAAVIVDYSAVHSLAGWWQSLPGLRPLLKLSYALNWALSPQPFGFHLVNLCIHLGNALLMLLWLRRVLPAHRHTLAAVVVLLWSVHPVTTEAVTYISGRSVSLASLFMLAALLTLAGPSRRAPLWAAVFTALALMVRETAWVLPLILLLVEWLRGRSAAAAWQRAWPAFAVVCVAAGLMLLEENHRAMLQTSLAERDALTQALTQIEAYRYFIAQALFRLAPNIDPDLPLHNHMSALLLLQATALLLVLLLAGTQAWRTRSVIAAGVLWFFLLLLPGNGFLPRLDVANDRHLYLPLAGLLLAGVWSVAALPAWLRRISLHLFPQTAPRLWALASSRLLPTDARVAQTGAVTMLYITLALLTCLRNLDYTDARSLWLRTAQQSPQKSRVWNNLGMACQQAGDRDCARAAFTRAVALAPDDTRAKANLYFLDR